MGQSASQPSSTADDAAGYDPSSSSPTNAKEDVIVIPPPPNIPNLHELDDVELKTLLLESRPLSIEEIKNVASSIYDVKTKKYKLKSKSNTNDDDDNNNNLGFYSTEADSPDIQLAIRINEISSQLSSSQKNKKNVINNVRFRLVPSRMREDLFWESVFTILKERLVEQKARNQLDAFEDDDDDDDDDDKKGGAGTSTINDDNKMNGQKQQQQRMKMNGTKASSSKKQSTAAEALAVPDDELLFADDDASSLESQLALRNSQVVYLSRQVKQLRKQLQQQQQQQQQNSSSSSFATTMSPKHHGHWIIDKDSKEFLEYPTELKENMRKAKKERLDAVSHEMRFILDSDQISDTNGYWDCCGSAGYHSSCDRT